MPAPATALSRTFNLDTGVLIPGSATKLTLTGDSPANVIRLVEGNKPFDGDVEIGRIALSLDSASSGDPIRFDVGSGSVNVAFSGGASIGVGVYENPNTVIDRLALKDDGLQPDISNGERYVIFRGAYDIKAHAEGTHPIGAIGALTFDSSVSRNKVFAVVHRIPVDEGARTSLDRAFTSLRLPGQFSDIGHLQPGTMLIAEANGSLAINLAAQLGYSFSFLRELEEVGLTGQIGMHVESGLKVSLGFQVAGRYLVVLDRKSQAESDSIVRLQVSKLRQRGWNFGLNLSVSVTPETEALPDNADDLVRATFGLHGRQIIDELNQIESWLDGLTAWTESEEEFEKHAAGFLSGALADLVQATTGKNPKTQFNEARKKLSGILAKWDDLPESVSAELWGLLSHGGLTAAERREFETVLKVIAEPGNDSSRREFISGVLTRAGFDSLPISNWLKAASDQGLAALLEDASALQPIAANTLAVLDGKFVENLQQVVTEKLNLDTLRAAVQNADYATVDAWLKRRLARFVGKLDLPVEELHEVASAVVKLLDKREVVYRKVLQALSKRRDFTFAFDYEAKTAKTALIDAEFDLEEGGAKRLLKQALGSRNYDSLLAEQARGVTLHNAVLTHEINRKTAVEVNMPFFSMKETNLTESMAQVTTSQPSSEGGRVLFYELDASNDNQVRDRLRGRLALAASASVPLGDSVRVFSKVDGGLSYEYREADENLKLRELDRRIKPAIRTYLPHRFPSADSLNEWIADLNLRTDVATGTGLDRIGDTLFALNVSLPAGVIKAWLRPRTKGEVARAKFALSLALQKSVKELIPLQYFSRVRNFTGNTVDSPLLLWAAMPPSASFRVRSGGIESDGKDFYWDFQDVKERGALIEDPRTANALALSIADAHDRLMNAGLESRAQAFVPGQGSLERIIGVHSNWKQLSGPLHGLLFAEATLLRRAAKALDEVSEFVTESETRPAEAIAALSRFGAVVTKTFNSGMASVYGSRAVRPLGTRIFLDGARALDPALENVEPNALMSLTVLKQDSGFDVESFLGDESPKPELIAAEERLATPSTTA